MRKAKTTIRVRAVRGIPQNSRAKTTIAPLYPVNVVFDV